MSRIAEPVSACARAENFHTGISVFRVSISPRFATGGRNWNFRDRPVIYLILLVAGSLPPRAQ